MRKSMRSALVHELNTHKFFAVIGSLKTHKSSWQMSYTTEIDGKCYSNEYSIKTVATFHPEESIKNPNLLIIHQPC